MAHNLMVEFPQTPNWHQLSLVATQCALVEMFPIVEEQGEPAAVGICLPLNGVTNDGWTELTQVLNFLESRFDGRVVDLYSGRQIAKGGYEPIRKTIFG
jgi:hypothetical protein